MYALAVHFVLGCRPVPPSWGHNHIHRWSGGDRQGDGVAVAWREARVWASRGVEAAGLATSHRGERRTASWACGGYRTASGATHRGSGASSGVEAGEPGPGLLALQLRGGAPSERCRKPSPCPSYITQIPFPCEFQMRRKKEEKKHMGTRKGYSLPNPSFSRFKNQNRPRGGMECIKTPFSSHDRLECIVLSPPSQSRSIVRSHFVWSIDHCKRKVSEDRQAILEGLMYARKMVGIPAKGAS